MNGAGMYKPIVLSFFTCGIVLLGAVSDGFSQSAEKFVFRYQLPVTAPTTGNEGFEIPDAVDVFPAHFALSAPTSFDVEVPTELSASQYAVLVTATNDLVGELPATVLPGQEYKVIAESPGGYRSESTISFKAGERKGKWTIRSQTVDVTPDMFSASGTPYLPNQTYELPDAITPTGFEAATEIFITSDSNSASMGSPEVLDAAVAAISVNGGPWRSMATIRPGESFRVRANSSGFSSSAVYYIAVVGENNGGVVGFVSLNTAPQDSTPSVPAMIYTSNAASGSTVYSEVVVPAEFNVPITLRIDAPYQQEAKVSVDGGPWVTETVIKPGQRFQFKYEVPDEVFWGMPVQYFIGTNGGVPFPRIWYVQGGG
jgi:hypothetical protein